MPVRDIKRGDIVVFKYPASPSATSSSASSACPGTRIELRAKKVYVNGQALDEPYVHFLTPSPRDRKLRRSTCASTTVR